jgi:ferredoxin
VDLAEFEVKNLLVDALVKELERSRASSWRFLSMSQRGLSCKKKMPEISTGPGTTWRAKGKELWFQYPCFQCKRACVNACPYMVEAKICISSQLFKRRSTVKPPLKSELEHVEGSVECPYGKIEIEYERDDVGRGVRMKVTVPTSTTGFLLLPSDSSSVSIQRMQLGADGDVVTQSGSRISLKPGRYSLHLKP